MERTTDGAPEAEGTTRTRRPRRASPGRKRASASARKAPARRPRRAAQQANTTLLEDVGTMAGHMGEYTWEAGQRAATATGRMMRDGSRTARRALTDMEHGVEGVLTLGGRYGGMLAERFREKPMATMAGLGAIALIAGWLFGGRR